MKIQTVEASITSNIPQGKKRQVGVSERGMSHIMGLLTNLYNDPELAVIREYYTNALDAHKMVSNSAPVKVTLPTWDKPNYIVQDEGVGMDEDTLFLIYGEYGESTGRDSNEIVGGFGLGSKSAYAISNQFTVASVKNGIQTTAHFSKMSHGAYDVQIVSSVETNKPNGTTVNIPINGNLNMFNDKARKFFSFSAPGSVLVDGVPPIDALDNAKQLDNPDNPDMIIHVASGGYGESYVIMGNVPYVLSSSEIKLSLQRIGVSMSNSFITMPKYFSVPIGSADISPNREGLQMTDRTNELVDSYISFIVNDLRKVAQAELDLVETLEDFWDAHGQWNAIVPIAATYRGESVPQEVKLDIANGGVRQITRSANGSASHTETLWVRTKITTDRIVVTGLDADHYKKINSYLTPYMIAEGINHVTFIVTSDKALEDNKWVKMSNHFSFIDFEKLIEIGRAQRKKDRLEASKLNGSSKQSKIKYPVLFVEESEIRWVNHDEIDSKTPYLEGIEGAYSVQEFIKSVYSTRRDIDISDELAARFELVTNEPEIILLNAARTVKALTQRVKETRPIWGEIKKAANALDVAPTPEINKYNSLRSSRWFHFLTNSGVDDLIANVQDPDIVQIISPKPEVIKAHDELVVRRETFKYFRHVSSPSMPELLNHADAAAIDKLDRKYPLVKSLNVWSLEGKGVNHIVKYFNMVHMDTLKS